MDIPKLCRYCGKLSGCRLLADAIGQFVPERLITERNYRECPEWVLGTPSQMGIREKLQEVVGDGAMRGIQQVPAIAQEEMLLAEREEELMEGDAPNFAAMLFEGITKSQREEQLRFETDESGNFVMDGDTMRPRPNFQLRQFAIDPEQHIQLPKGVAMFWSTDQLVEHILKTELEQELILKDKKGSKKEEPKPQQRETEEMAGEGRRVSVNRTGPKAPVRVPTKAQGGGDSGGDEGGTVARPPRKAGAPAAAGPRRAPGPARAPGNTTGKAPVKTPSKVAEAEAPAAAAVDLSEVLTKFDEMKGLIDELRGEIKEVRADCVLAVTLLHDALAQTGGSLRFPVQAQDEEGNPLWVGWDEEGNEQYFLEPVEGGQVLQAQDENGEPLWTTATDRFGDDDLILGYAREIREAMQGGSGE